jgi:hypothetical protein
MGAYANSFGRYQVSAWGRKSRTLIANWKILPDIYAKNKGGLFSQQPPSAVQ